jgi:hypothetical protein
VCLPVMNMAAPEPTRCSVCIYLYGTVILITILEDGQR